MIPLFITWTQRSSPTTPDGPNPARPNRPDPHTPTPRVDPTRSSPVTAVVIRHASHRCHSIPVPPPESPRLVCTPRMSNKGFGWRLKTVRICCIGLVGLHHLFYKGVAGPLGLQAATPSGTSPGVGPLGLQGRQPIRVQGVRHPWCRLPQVPPPLEVPPLVPPPLADPRGSPPPINVTPHLSIEASNCTAIHLL
jgi:hypothetical protein